MQQSHEELPAVALTGKLASALRQGRNTKQKIFRVRHTGAHVMTEQGTDSTTRIDRILPSFPFESLIVDDHLVHVARCVSCPWEG